MERSNKETISTWTRTGTGEGEAITGSVGRSNGLASNHIHTPPVCFGDLDWVEEPFPMAAWQKLAQWRLVFIRSWFISVAVFQKPSDDGAGIGRGHAILAGGGASTVAADFLPGALVVVLALDVTGEAVFVEYHGLTWAHEGDTVTGQVDGDLAGRAAASTAELRVGARIMVRALLVAGIQCLSRTCWDVGELGFTSFLPHCSGEKSHYNTGLKSMQTLFNY